MKAVTPSASSPRALASRLAMVRVVPSVPRQPTTVVTPAVVRSLSTSSGVRVA